MKTKKQLSWLSLVFIIICQIDVYAKPSKAISQSDDNPCLSTPNYSCLTDFIGKQLRQPKLKGDNSNQQQWQLETAKIKKNKTGGSKLTGAWSKQFFLEEQILQQIEQNQTLARPTKLPYFYLPMQDSRATSPASILIETLTLQLQDQKANLIKRQLLEYTMEHRPTRINHTVLQIAQAEIVGGAPTKGLESIATATLDEFSDTRLVHEKQVTSMMGSLSEKLFLDPTYRETRCDDDTNPITQSIDTLLNRKTIELLVTIQQTPEQSARTKLLLSLIQLHKNAGSCPLLMDLLIQYSIQSEIELYLAQESSITDLIFFSRAMRRYLL